jgi:hypothetical protein
VTCSDAVVERSRNAAVGTILGPVQQQIQQPDRSGTFPGGVTGWGKPVDDYTALRDIQRIRSGRSRMSVERLQKIADVYRQHVDDRPTEAVARAFGVSHRTSFIYV